MNIAFKKQLFDFCDAFVIARLERIHKHINDIQTALSSETKSSAGDKHETGRAMLQLEREKLGVRLAEAEKMRHTLLKVPLTANSELIGLGTWVKTTKAQYYLAISAGEFSEKNNMVYCISTATPIGLQLLGKSSGEAIHFNGEQIQILEIS